MIINRDYGKQTIRFGAAIRIADVAENGVISPPIAREAKEIGKWLKIYNVDSEVFSAKNNNGTISYWLITGKQDLDIARNNLKNAVLKHFPKKDEILQTSVEAIEKIKQRKELTFDKLKALLKGHPGSGVLNELE